MYVIKRKQVVAICLAVLMCVAGYLNFTYKKSGDTAKIDNVGEIHLVDEEENKDFFESARLEREISRAEVRETLATVIDDENTEETSKQKAEEEVINVAKQTDSESSIETLIRAKGFEDAIVYLNDGKASAVVKAAELTGEDATKIAEIITEQTGIPMSEIKITQSY